jgi:N6-adenosine-specific RNA methylase IME4/ParB-like chromosome segregation protein Spo0J
MGNLSVRSEEKLNLQVMPELSESEYQELKADIEERGVQVPVELDEEGNILDGYHRVKVCNELGISDYPTIIRYGMTDEEKRLHARKLNMARRHLNGEQKRELIAAQLRETPEWSDRQIAKGFGVDHKTVGAVRKGSESTGEIPQLEKRIGADGKERTSRKRPVAIFSQDARGTQRTFDLLSAVEDRPDQKEQLVTGRASVDQISRSIRKDERRQERIQRLQALTEEPIPELGKMGKFPIIYADPPWRYEHSASPSREIENHYPTMAIEEICSLPVNEIATQDAVLFLWATSPKVAEAVKVIETWGFDFRTCMVWVKDRIGPGYYARQQHELLFIAIKGNPPTPSESDRHSSVIQAPRREHSQKPDEVYEIIEAMYPELKKVELFAREKRYNWGVWGYEAFAYSQDTQKLHDQGR